MNQRQFKPNRRNNGNRDSENREIFARGVHLKEFWIQLKEFGIQLKESGIRLKESGIQLEESGIKLYTFRIQLKESGIQLKEFGIPLTIGIQNSSCTEEDWNLESTTLNPESKTV